MYSTHANPQVGLETFTQGGRGRGREQIPDEIMLVDLPRGSSWGFTICFSAHV